MMADFFLKKDELGNTEYIKISAAKEKNKAKSQSLIPINMMYI